MKIAVNIAILVALLGAAPAWAQKDALKVDEKLNVNLVKKSDAKEIKPAKSKTDAMHVGEALEIETSTRKNEVKK